MELKRLHEERKFFKKFNLKDEAKLRKIILEGHEVYNQIFGVPEGKKEEDEPAKSKQEEEYYCWGR
jgi:hypothetical protein